jgi:pimeloyl-ACP methyl ester carboxylesterase
MESPPTTHAWTPRKVVFVSGLSDPATCALTSEQRALLDALPVEQEAKVGWNFPFVPGPEDLRKPPSLWQAAWRNYRQFLDAPSDRYRRLAEPHWRALRDSTAELSVIALSCGLEIVNQFLDPIRDANVRVLALGPVARRRPPVPHTLIQGSTDWISRRFFPAADVTIPAVGHMDYVTHPEVVGCLRDRLWTNTSR